MSKLSVAALAAGLALIGCSLTVPGAAAYTDVSDTFQPESLAWHQCDPDIVAGAQAYDNIGPVKVSTIIQCAELQVPLDYADPDGQKITLELTKTPHQGSGPAKGDLVVNPGGPGEDGALFGPLFYALNSPAMQAGYNMIGFDPRGVGFSTPRLSCDPHYYDAPRPPYGTGGAQDEAVWKKKAQDYADACAAKYGAGAKVDLLDHIKTIDVARDLNTIRAALGHDRLDYYGASYGTYLGQNFAALFPTRVHRMALDGNLSPNNIWYKNLLLQDVGFQRNIEHYYAWIAQYDDHYHLGTTQAAVQKFVDDLKTKLATSPVHYNTLAVGPDELLDVLVGAAYRRNQSSWNSYASGLSAYKSGDMATFADTFGEPTTGSDDNIMAVYNAVDCTDNQWPTSWDTWHNDAVRVSQSAPFYTWGNLWGAESCRTWPATRGTPVDLQHAKNLPTNILMFQSDLDAATPYSGAQETHEMLPGSHMVVQDNEPTHCIVHRGDTRPGGVDSYYDAYFLNGTLPKDDIVHVSSLGDPTPPSTTTKAKPVLDARDEPPARGYPMG